MYELVGSKDAMIDLETKFLGDDWTPFGKPSDTCSTSDQPPPAKKVCRSQDGKEKNALPEKPTLGTCKLSIQHF